jgi:hypothetical protein
MYDFNNIMYVSCTHNCKVNDVAKDPSEPLAHVLSGMLYRCGSIG